MRLQKGFLGDEEGGRSEKKTNGSWMPPNLVGCGMVRAQLRV